MVLKWWLCLLLGGMLNLPATAQQKTAPRVNLKVEKTSLIRAIEALRSQTRYNFLFNSKDLQPYTDISVHLQSVTLQQALDSLLIGRKTGLGYTIDGETVVIPTPNPAAGKYANGRNSGRNPARRPVCLKRIFT